MSDNTSSYKASSPELHEAISAWFLGPQAENADLLKELFNLVVNKQAEARASYHPEDGIFITDSIKESSTFQQSVGLLRQEFTQLADLLNEYSIPFYSPRYAGHMSFENSLPSILGYLATMLFNPNNVAFEASPITTLLELDVGSQLCDMLGYKATDNMQPWGHIACDGTVANLESIWAARNLKFYPLSLRNAMGPGQPLEFVADSLRVHKCGTPNDLSLFNELKAWDLLNLKPEEVLAIPDRLRTEYGISSTFLEETMRKYIVQSTGKDVLESQWGVVHPPQYLITSTKHYSWPKGAALAGIGSDNMVNVAVDHDARIDIKHLRAALDTRLKNKQAVYAVVAIIGSTEEGAVDPLDEIIRIRDEYQEKGMSFIVHADAAWGGYFASMIREMPVFRSPGHPSGDDDDDEVDNDRDYVPTLALRDTTVKQFEALQHADSITIDPHKSGYVPYPAGGLCYRDGRMRFLLTWTAPYLNQGSNGENIGVYGVEGSKPGASAAAVYLHHRVVGLHKYGHGALLGEVTFSCSRMSAHWATLSDTSTPFIVVPFNKLQDESSKEAIEGEKRFIKRHIIGRSNEDLVNDPDPHVMTELRALGSDLNINAFACNFRIKSEHDPNVWLDNDDIEEANYLNKCIFERLSVTDVGENPADTPMYITSTAFSESDYGECVKNFKQRMSLETDSTQDLFVLRNVCMSPFQPAADFVNDIAKIFKQTLEEEMEHVVERNTIKPQSHTFLMQGTDKLHLIYRPLFHKANSKCQLILSGDIKDSKEWSAYVDAIKTSPEDLFTFTTTEMTLDRILAGGNIGGKIYRGGELLTMSTLSNIAPIKQRPLLSKYRDAQYPTTMPFYLYGTPVQQHIDHMLLKAPNAQLSARNVSLELDRSLSAAQLAQGLVLRLEDRHERAMLPLDVGQTRDPLAFFAPGAKFRVTVCEDGKKAMACGPGLLEGGKVVARGTVTLPAGKGSVFVDYVEVNRQEFRQNPRNSAVTGAGKMSEVHKEGWRELVSGRMGVSVSVEGEARGSKAGVGGEAGGGVGVGGVKLGAQGSAKMGFGGMWG